MAKTSLLTQECCTSHQGLASCLSPLPHTAGSTWSRDPTATSQAVSDTPLLMLHYVSPLFWDKTMRLLLGAQGDRSGKVLSPAQPLSCTSSEGWEWPTDQTDPVQRRDHGWVCKWINGERDKKQISTGSKRVLKHKDFAKFSEKLVKTKCTLQKWYIVTGVTIKHRTLISFFTGVH